MSNTDIETVTVPLVTRRRRLRALENWRPLAGLANLDALFNEALTIYMWTVQERSAGHVLASVDPFTGQYVKLPMLSLDEKVVPGTVLVEEDDDRLVRVPIKVPSCVLEAFDTQRRYYGFTTHMDLLNRGADTFLLAAKACNNKMRFGAIGEQTGYINWLRLPFLDEVYAWLNQS